MKSPDRNDLAEAFFALVMRMARLATKRDLREAEERIIAAVTEPSRDDLVLLNGILRKAGILAKRVRSLATILAVLDEKTETLAPNNSEP